MVEMGLAEALVLAQVLQAQEFFMLVAAAAVKILLRFLLPPHGVVV